MTGGGTGGFFTQIPEARWASLMKADEGLDESFRRRSCTYEVIWKGRLAIVLAMKDISRVYVGSLPPILDTVGVAHVRYDHPVAFIQYLHVEKLHQDQGIQRQLVSEAIKLAQGLDVRIKRVIFRDTAEKVSRATSKFWRSLTFVRKGKDFIYELPQKQWKRKRR